MSLHLQSRAGHLTRTTTAPYHLTFDCDPGCDCLDYCDGVGPCAMDFTLGSATLPTSCVPGPYFCDPTDPQYGTIGHHGYYWLTDPLSGVSGCIGLGTCEGAFGFGALSALIDGAHDPTTACPINPYTALTFDVTFSLRIIRRPGIWYVDFGVAASVASSGYLFLGYAAEDDCFAPFSVSNLLSGSGCQTVDSTMRASPFLMGSDPKLPAVGSIDSIVFTPRRRACA